MCWPDTNERVSFVTAPFRITSFPLSRADPRFRDSLSVHLRDRGGTALSQCCLNLFDLAALRSTTGSNCHPRHVSFRRDEIVFLTGSASSVVGASGCERT